jgi:tetratricopeptide (TPR) repeat protein
LIALICLILYGAFSATALATILILFVVLRFTSLLAEAFRQPITAEQWEKTLGTLTDGYAKLTPEQLATKAIALKLHTGLNARELAQAQVNHNIRAYVQPRSKRELGAEALGVVTFAIVIPLTIALFTRPIFSFRGGQGWEGALVAACCLGLYAWPHRWLKSAESSELRTLWWAIPFVVAFPLLIHAIDTRHPYLNPFNPDHNRLAAERVLSLNNNVVAGQYADWVLRYARELDERGESQQAIDYYRASLRLDSNNHAAYERLSRLESQISGGEIETNPMLQAHAPYWTANNPITPSPRGQIDEHLENVTECTIVVVPVGEVPDNLLDAVGFVIHQELGLPVCISTNVVPIPPYTRKRGLATNPQWNVTALIQSFTNAAKFYPNAPIRYVMVTPVDIYMEDTTYVVSVSCEWGALVSSARFGDPGGDVRERTAKQSLCALLKSFGIQQSPDRNDVTSYARTPAEFEAKGGRPDAATLKQFHQALADINGRWQIYKAQKRAIFGLH